MKREDDTPVRILVDHSGYALQNIGDIAMLQACIRRLRALWPDAHIDVFTESPNRLDALCPGTNAVLPTIAGRRQTSVLPLSAQLAAEQLWKIVVPLLDISRRDSSGAGAKAGHPRQQEAVRRADLVVSSGGGFVNDVFWWHGAGVLSILSMAQRLGKPTAMFGQGIGPLTHPLLRRLVAHTMPRLEVIGLREGVRSVDVLKANRVEHQDMLVTGDDALLLATAPRRPRTGSLIGINVRVAAYSQVAEDVGARVVAVTRATALEHGLPVAALPVENNRTVSDLAAMGISGTDEDCSAGHEVGDVRTPQELVERVSRCRVVVTGSYHAAVFGLAAGIPAICVTNSPYYDGKFEGLAALFPGGCQIVGAGSGLERDLSAAIDRALTIDEGQRDDIHASALAQVAKADRLYERFKSRATLCVRQAQPTATEPGKQYSGGRS